MLHQKDHENLLRRVQELERQTQSFKRIEKELRESEARLQRQLHKHRHVSKALKESEASIRAIFLAAPAGIGVMIDRVITAVNQNLCQMLGYASRDLLGQIVDIFYPDEVQSDAAYCEPLHLLEGRGNIETCWCRKDGSIIDVMVSATPIYAGDPSSGVTFTALDITERKRSEQALLASQKELDSIINTIPDIIYRIDAEGRITFISQAVLRYGYRPEGLLGTSFLALLHPEDRPKTAAHINQWLKGHEYHEPFEVRLLTPSKTIVPFEVYKIAARDESGRPASDPNNRLTIQGIARDVTDRSKAEKEKLYREKLQGMLELAGAICHELNQPIQSISGFAELLLLNCSGSEPYYDKLRRIKEQVDRMGRITTRLNNITRYETKQYLSGRIIDIKKASPANEQRAAHNQKR